MPYDFRQNKIHLFAQLHVCSIIFLLRHILAVVHFNMNLQREVKKKDVDGGERVKVSYPKFKNGEATVRNARIVQNFGKHSFHDNILFIDDYLQHTVLITTHVRFTYSPACCKGDIYNNHTIWQ